MSLAIFDLDNTLIGGDSDVLWGQFLGEQGYVDATEHEAKHQVFYEDYLAGTLNIMAFLEFQLAILAQHDMHKLTEMRSNYIEEKIRPILLPQANQLIQSHLDEGNTPVIITATNRFITQPIADSLGIEHLIATEPEAIEGRYTGKVSGVPSYAEGKVVRMTEWLELHERDLGGSWFYSDSHNDLPLLSLVTHPVAVDPDDTLAIEARERRWPIISLRTPRPDQESAGGNQSL